MTSEGKNEGPGITAPRFRDENRGVEFEMAGEELARVNTFHSTHGLGALKATLGIRWVDSGKDEEGHWDHGMLAERTLT